MRGEEFRFWTPVVLLAALAAFTGQKLARAHLSDVSEPRYGFERETRALRGGIYDSTKDPATGGNIPLVKSSVCWEYRLDPVAMTNARVRVKGGKPRTVEAMARTISQTLGLDYAETLSMCRNTSKRYQLLKTSGDRRAHDILTNRSLMAGVIAEETDERRYFEENRLAHVLGGVNAQGDGSCGIEQKFNSQLKGTPGRIKGVKDGRGREIVEKRQSIIPPVRGADVYLTVNRHLQYEVEKSLAAGLAEYGAESGWCVVLDARSGAVLAMATLPGFDPSKAGRAREEDKVNKAVAFTYEPGSVMKTITACAAIDSGFASPDTLFSTDRQEKDADGKFKYYKLPGDGSHVWEPRMSLRDAIVHSCNIVMGKIGFDMGPAKLGEYMKKFGFGAKTGIELPGEECGIVRDPSKWDLATRSRAAIGQGISVTAIQMASAYQAIANDGVRIAPRIVAKVAGAAGATGGVEVEGPPAAERVISASASVKAREMMLAVASKEGTARRAALHGYSVAGKTGTAQKARGGSYVPGLYRATFCGIVPSGVVAPEAGVAPVPPRIVALVTLDFEERRKYHQGGNSAAPVFKNIAQEAMRIFEVPPDRPDELLD